MKNARKLFISILVVFLCLAMLSAYILPALLTLGQ